MRRRVRPKKTEPVPVALGAVVREKLPLPVIYYTNHYGTFFAFAEDESSPAYICSCAEPAIRNLLRLERLLPEMRCADPLREAPLDSSYFPDVVAKASVGHSYDPLRAVRFRPRLCHRCNLATPTLRYCHEMYGGRFKQTFGWYINQTYLRLGIHPLSLEFLHDVCPREFQEQIAEVKRGQAQYLREEERLKAVVFGPKREDIPPDEILYWSNVRFSEAGPMIVARKKAARLTTAFTNTIENMTRQEFGVRKVGDAWVSETILYNIVCRIFPDSEVLRHDRPEWLGGLELDIYLPKLNVAVEYQGQQHFHPVKVWGGTKALELVRARDALKAKLCHERKVHLVLIDYTEPLAEEHVRAVLKEVGVLGDR